MLQRVRCLKCWRGRIHPKTGSSVLSHDSILFIHSKRKAYIQTAGVVMLGLRTMRLYAKDQLRKEGIENYSHRSSNKSNWWVRALDHVGARYDWVRHSKRCGEAETEIPQHSPIKRSPLSPADPMGMSSVWIWLSIRALSLQRLSTTANSPVVKW